LKPIDDLTVRCIRCGFCLEDCPTFKISGNELESPRGRIYLVRSVMEGHLTWKDAQPHLDHCLGCLACETACPSGVEYGEIIELAREKLNEVQPRPARRAFLESTTNHAALKASLAIGNLLPGKRIPRFVSQLISGEPPEVDQPKPQNANLPEVPADEMLPAKGDVYFLEGCAMDVLFSRVHQASKNLLARLGFSIKSVNQGCCGSMHAHQGYMDKARKYGESLVKSMPDAFPVVVDSAGCGSTMKRYAELLAGSSVESSEADEFAKRTFDISEFLLNNGLLPLLKSATKLEGIKITYHDACHLAHGQRIKDAPRELLKAIPGIEWVEMAESDTCCGSAGVYNALEPSWARALLDRKMDFAGATGASIIALGNPGCHAWMAQGAKEKFENVRVMHTSEVLEAAFIGLDEF